MIGQVAATLTATFALSFVGTAGTIIGLALGSTMSAVLPTIYENALRRSQHRAKLLRERQRQAAASATSEGDYEHLYKSDEPASTPRISLPWKRMGIAAAAAFCVCALTVTVVESIAGKPVSDVVTDKRGSGYTFSGGSSRPAGHVPVLHRQQHTSAPATSSPSSSPSGEATPSPTPSASPTQPASPSPSPSASAVASSTASSAG